ncbi:hypothetical protein M2412_002769 [Stenotrophomonas rhizophila]|uniref:Uncharacterized protein n=1 Tax=Stenotrophomonas rhizophila TaxID=216778 RepID=A0AAW5PKD9_9GAMM|nr:hypothetical protein [Stenotrophomonas rhizophila]
MEREDHRCQGLQHGWASPLDSSKQACSVASTTEAQGRLDQTGECIENTWSDSVMDVMPFLQAIAQAETPPRAPNNGWRHGAGRAASGNTCAFCTSALDLASPQSWRLIALVPLELGGPPHISDNWVPSCRRCAATRGMRDVVSWMEWHASFDPAVVSALLEQRTAALLFAENHFTALLRYSNRHRHLSSLASRFSHPRFLVHAWSGPRYTALPARRRAKRWISDSRSGIHSRSSCHAHRATFSTPSTEKAPPGYNRIAATEARSG